MKDEVRERLYDKIFTLSKDYCGHHLIKFSMKMVEVNTIRNDKYGKINYVIIEPKKENSIVEYINNMIDTLHRQEVSLTQNDIDRLEKIHMELSDTYMGEVL